MRGVAHAHGILSFAKAKTKRGGCSSWRMFVRCASSAWIISPGNPPASGWENQGELFRATVEPFSGDHCLEKEGKSHEHPSGKEREEEQKSVEYLPILAEKENTSGCRFTHIIFVEGDHPFITHCLCRDLDILGYSESLIKRDQEPALVRLCDAVKGVRQDTMMPQPISTSQTQAVKGAWDNT